MPLLAIDRINLFFYWYNFCVFIIVSMGLRRYNAFLKYNVLYEINKYFNMVALNNSHSIFTTSYPFR